MASSYAHPLEIKAARERKVLVIKPEFRFFPMGYAYVLACLEEAGIPFDFVDTHLQGHCYEEMLAKNDYIAVATGGLIADIKSYLRVVETTRRVSPGTPVIVGGNVVNSLEYETMLDGIGCDFLVLGEAETALPALLENLARPQIDFAKLPGLVFRNAEGALVKTPAVRMPIEQWNLLPAWHHIDIEYYLAACTEDFHPKKFLPILTGRGCPGACTFCRPHLRKFYRRPVEWVVDEIVHFSELYNFDIAFFLNEVMFDDEDDVVAFCEAYKKTGPIKPFYALLRPDMDPRVLRPMRDAGCMGINVGFESGNNDVLRRIGKESKVDQLSGLMAAAREAEIWVDGTFMLAHENETPAEIEDSFAFARRERIWRFPSITLSYPGTALYHKAHRRGLIADKWETALAFNYEAAFFQSMGLKEIQDRYINQSSLPKEELFPLLFSKLRSFSETITENCRVSGDDIRLTVHDAAAGLYDVDVACINCGTHIAVQMRADNIANFNLKCSACRQYLVTDFSRTEPFVEHFADIRAATAAARRIVVVGPNNQNAAGLIFQDSQGVDEEKLLGFVEADDRYRGDVYFHYPLLRVADLPALRPDLLVITGDADRADAMINRTFGREAPARIYLEPTSRAALIAARRHRLLVMEKAEDLIACGGEVYLYGCGALGRSVRQAAQDAGVPGVAGFIDSEKSGRLSGLPVFSLSDYRATRHKSDNVIVICTTYRSAVLGNLADLPACRVMDASHLVFDRPLSAAAD